MAVLQQLAAGTKGTKAGIKNALAARNFVLALAVWALVYMVSRISTSWTQSEGSSVVYSLFNVEVNLDADLASESFDADVSKSFMAESPVQAEVVGELPHNGEMAEEWMATHRDAVAETKAASASPSLHDKGPGAGQPTIFDADKVYIRKHQQLRMATRAGSVAELGRSAYRCDDVEREHCVFDNICVRYPGAEGSSWFALNPMQGYDAQPFAIHHRNNTVFELHLPVLAAKDGGGHVDIVDDNVHMFNPMHANRFFLFARAFSLWLQTRTLSRDVPYHVMYFTPPGYNTRISYELMGHMTYSDRPMYLYPHGLRSDQTEVDAGKTVCFRRIEFQWPPLLTWLMTGPPEDYDDLMTKGVFLGHDVLADDAVLRMLLPRFRDFYAAKMGANEVSMVPNRALLVTRNVFGKSKKPYRVIVNEDELVKVLERHGLEVDVVDFAQLNNTEQIQRTRQASLFVGMHGAGMANLVWLDPKAVVLELHPYGFQKWGYQRLCRYMQQPYVSWTNQKEENSFHTWASSQYKSLEEDWDFYRHRDQYVEPSEFEEKLLEALAISRGANAQ